jgi:cytoskeletal protein RodZ
MKMAFDLCRIGQLLRETREKKGLTFDEVSNALCIKKQAIGAIEAGDWDHLPHPVYVKGYVTHYATFLNMLGALKSELASGENESPAHNLLGGRFETAADEACTGKMDRIWRSIFATSTLKFYELCQKCFLL